MTDYRATVETATSVIEAQAAAARALFSVLHPTESWDELSGQADRKETPALARQAAFMRAARFGLDGYARFSAGVRHRNPLSPRERQLVALVWSEVVVTPDNASIRNAARLAGVHLSRFNDALAGRVNSAGFGAVTAMVRDYSRALVRIAGLNDVV